MASILTITVKSYPYWTKMLTSLDIDRLYALIDVAVKS